MSWCKFPGVPQGKPRGMAADKCITKSSHHLSHDRASEGHGSIPCLMSQTDLHRIKGAFVWDQSGIRIIGIMRVSVCLGAILT